MKQTPPDEHAAEEARAPEERAGHDGEHGELLEAVRQELEQTRAQYQRALADYQNLQRRARQERVENERYTLTALVLNFLPVLDDLSRALDSVDADFEGHQWVEGVRLVRQKFRNVLEATGIQEIAADGELFNPAVHEAVGYAPGEEGRVVQLVQAGYALGERVVRPAMVLVGNGEQPAAAAGEQSERSGG
jgi:molecular chaperone GrpE